MEKHFKRWSKEDDAVLEECLEKGLSKAVIAQALGRTADSVTWRATYIRKTTQRSLPLRAPAKKVEPAPKAEVQPKPPEMPDALLDRVMEAERMVQQIPMLTLIAGAGAMMSFTTLVLVVLALVS